MSFDTIIIGGGLSGLTCGITLAKAGRRVAIVSAGQSTLHFNGGTMELLGCVDGQPVDDPIAAIAHLPADHPYHKLGAESCVHLADEARQLLSDVGVYMQGQATRNHWRITPIGATKPAWLSLQGMAVAQSPHRLPWPEVTLINLNGFLDLPIDFMAHNMELRGTRVTIKDIECDFLATARRNATEMRATNLARTLTSTAKLNRLAEAINTATEGDPMVIMPAVVGLESSDAASMLQSQVKAPLQFVSTMPPTVPGTRMAALLRHYFKMLGGTFMPGDTVCKAVTEQHRVERLHTTKLQDTPLQSEHYVLAAGSFMSMGLMSNSERIYEPLFDLDLDAPTERERWSQDKLMGNQPFMGCGVLTDSRLRALRGGQPIDNLWAIGAILGGHNPVVLGDGTGVDLLTALTVAHHIIDTHNP